MKVPLRADLRPTPCGAPGHLYDAAMASKKAYLDQLRMVSLFAGCSTKDLEKIARAGDEVRVQAGHLIIDQGQTGREAFVIVEGSATVRRNGKKVTTLGPGSVVGELSLLDHGPRTATVITDVPTTLFVIDQRRFAGVIDEVPAIAHKLMASLASRIRDLDRQIYG
jgi:CRP/FNR family transcriptional regulator, cyclic AMP receptor protein